MGASVKHGPYSIQTLEIRRKTPARSRKNSRKSRSRRFHNLEPPTFEIIWHSQKLFGLRFWDTTTVLTTKKSVSNYPAKQKKRCPWNPPRFSVVFSSVSQNESLEGFWGIIVLRQGPGYSILAGQGNKHLPMEWLGHRGEVPSKNTQISGEKSGFWMFFVPKSHHFVRIGFDRWSKSSRCPRTHKCGFLLVSSSL